MKLKDRKVLMAKSLLAFGRRYRYQEIMRRGRPEFHKDGTFKHTAPISYEEIEDTMDYILSEREKIQNVQQENDQGTTRVGDNTDRTGADTEGQGSIGGEA